MTFSFNIIIILYRIILKFIINPLPQAIGLSESFKSLQILFNFIYISFYLYDTAYSSGSLPFLTLRHSIKITDYTNVLLQTIFFS